MTLTRLKHYALAKFNELLYALHGDPFKAVQAKDRAAMHRRELSFPSRQTPPSVYRLSAEDEHQKMIADSLKQSWEFIEQSKRKGAA